MCIRHVVLGLTCLLAFGASLTRCAMAAPKKYVPVPAGKASCIVSLRYAKSLRKKGVNESHIRGVIEEELGQALAGRVVNVNLTTRGKCCAYVTLNCEADARLVLEGLHQKRQASMFNATLYAAFVECLSPEEALARRSGIADVTTTDDVVVPGMLLFPNFVTEEEEANLMEELGQGPWERLIARRVRHFGFRFNYKTRRCDQPGEAPPGDAAADVVSPLTPGVRVLCDRIAGEMVGAGVDSDADRARPDQLTVNQYEPGQGIAPHVDTHSAFGPAIQSLTLGAGIVMSFRHPSNGLVKHVWLPRRSMLVMSGEARFLWTHGICCRKTDVVNGKLVRRGTRLSATFRTVMPPTQTCTCSFPEQCDSQLAPEHVSTLESKAPPELETQHVHSLYGELALWARCRRQCITATMCITAMMCASATMCTVTDSVS